jgi:glyoxylase-like metal-dependent hydrolase (beta-lactamase superfamily II)
MIPLNLPALNASPWTGPTGNNTYLLDGAIPTLIDAGVGHPEHVAAIASALGGRGLRQVLITHSHVDHVAGLPVLTARWPGLRVRAFEPTMVDGAEPLHDGEIIRVGDGALRVLATPGHAPDHCCFIAGDDMYCGDLARAGGTIVIAASRGGDLIAYLESLARVRALAPRRLLPGHGPAVDDPAAVIEAYLRHRAERESQVLEQLRTGETTPSEIAAAIYRGLDASLIPAALETVMAHLVKLERDGKAVSDGERWTAEK